MNYPLETERLLIRPTIAEDASFLLELMNSPKWLENIGDRNLTTELDAIEYIEKKMTPQLERLGFSNNTLIRKSDRVKIGSCGLYDRDGLEGVDIGFALLPAYEKMGYAFEASAAVRDMAFNDFRIPLIQAITLPQNMDSRRLIEKLGLELKGSTILPNEDEELLLYKMDNPFLN